MLPLRSPPRRQCGPGVGLMTGQGESHSLRPTLCLECSGPLGRKPRSGSDRPADVCANCWRRQRPWERNPGFRERKQKRHQAERRQLHAEGLCTDCRQAFEGNTYLCPNCRARRQQAALQVAAELVASGICRRCQQRPAAPERTRCEACLAKAQADSQERRERQQGSTGVLAERCRSCGEPMGRRPRRDGGRPLDVCVSCWQRVSPEERRKARRVARRRELQRRRYRERIKGDPGYAEQQREYMREYMREYRKRRRQS